MYILPLWRNMQQKKGRLIKMKTFVLASKNQHKADEIKKILGEDFEVITQTEAGAGAIDVIEDGNTFEANAIKKAETIMKATGKPTIADDSGLCVDYLGGAPGIYTARYAGEGATDEENINKLLAAMKDADITQRDAKFVCVIALSFPDRDTVTFRGECAGKIAPRPKGDGGFGYDPVFYIPKYDATMGQLDAHIKNAISHRSDALRKFAGYFK